MQKMSKNSVVFGFICGVLAPILGFWLYYFFKTGGFTHMLFLERIKSMHLLSAVLSLSLLSNLALFFVFLQFKLDNSAKGILLATILYAIAGFIIKFFF